MLESIRQIIRLASNKQLPFLLIGGHAVILYGVPRFTRDIDLLIPESKETDWIQFLEKLGYTSYHRTPAFVQFDTNKIGETPPLDLVLVDQPTWDKLFKKSQSQSLGGGISVSLPDPVHLIAMKLQAASSSTRRADATDWSDVLQLIHTQDLDLDDEGFAAIVNKYGGTDALTRLKQDLS